VLFSEETKMRIKSRFLLPVLLCSLSVSGFAQLQKPQVSPRVVAQITKTGQTAGIPQKTLFIPKADGLFRMSVYLASYG
jgi:hypothetical protein